jgi:gliding motility-associated protein GldL
MNLLSFVRSRGYRNFMAKLYGWGASVVIIGALFKINHYPGADYMLIVGLGTESLIFFFSAFEPPHVEPDWSLVYPQLAGLYHGGPDGEKAPMGISGGMTGELDNMLEKAKIGPELIESLGTGLRNLSETTSKLNNVSNASLANDQFVTTLKTATESASVLNESYRKSAKSMEHNLAIADEHSQHMQAVAKNASMLSNAYAEVSQSLKDEINSNKDFTKSIESITLSANKFVEKYNQSAEMITKTTEALNATTVEGNNYNKQLQKISGNLSALNALYELHLQGSNDYLQVTGKANETMGKLMDNLNKSVDYSTKFRDEVDSLAKNIATLNKVYGNMLSAMNANVK